MQSSASCIKTQDDICSLLLPAIKAGWYMQSRHNDMTAVNLWTVWLLQIIKHTGIRVPIPMYVEVFRLLLYLYHEQLPSVCFIWKKAIKRWREWVNLHHLRLSIQIQITMIWCMLGRQSNSKKQWSKDDIDFVTLCQTSEWVCIIDATWKKKIGSP